MNTSRLPIAIAGLVAGSLLVAGCGGPDSDSGAGAAGADGASGNSDASGTSSTETGDAPADSSDLSWGPSTDDVAAAEEIVAAMSDEQLAGQVIVGRYRGTDPAEAERMVRRLHLAGLSVTSDNVVDADQVRAMTAGIARAVAADGREFPAVIGVDEEGGVVSHLRGVATEFPAFEAAGDAIEADPKAGRRIVQQAAYATSMELRDLGFTWVFAPVADVTIGAADPTIGTRSPSEDPRIAAAAVAAAVRGYNRAGIVSTTKHFPGHGGVTTDSHQSMPVLSSSLEDLRARDLIPFEAATRVGAPAVMVSHIDVEALDPGLPASLAPGVYEFLRSDIGFEGVTITDSMGMGAVAGRPLPGVTALEAGADLLLMPGDTARTHATLVDALASGELDRDRTVEAATQVVALQLWQQRVAEERPVPEDPAALAAAAADALTP